MKVSARNVFKGNISKLDVGVVNAKVDIDLGGDDTLVAVVTMDSVKSLDLVVGKEVVAIVKAPWVMLMADGGDMHLSARNILRGTVKAIEQGSVNTEVILSLRGGTEITSIVTKDAVAELGLKIGSPISAVIKASSVILGVSAK